MGRTISRRSALLGIIGLGLSLVFGCGCSPSSSDCVPTKKPGSCCKTDQDCSPREKCAVALPQGYCAEPCTQESPVCPEDTICARFTFTSNVASTGFYCLAKCGAGFVPCREDYFCKSEGDSQARWPQ